MRRMIAIMIVLILLVSGCSKPAPEPEPEPIIEPAPVDYNAVTITRFGFDSSVVTDYYRSRTDFTLHPLEFNIEHNGGRMLEGNAFMYISGPQMDTYEFAPSERSHWSVDLLDKAGFEDVKSVIYREIGTKIFLPATDEEEAGKRELTLNMLPPNMREGQTLSYTFSGTVCYPYSATASYAVGDDLSLADVSNDVDMDGPIKPKLAGLSSVGDKLSLNITVDDLGGGYAVPSIAKCSGTPSAFGRRFVYLEVIADGETTICGDDGLVEARVENPSTICEIDATQVSEIRIKASYKYYTEKRDKITVVDEPNDA